MNAGALKISGLLGDAPIPPARLSIQVFLPDRNDPEAKLILPNLKANEAECLPEGAYHVVSKLMDGTPGSATQTNSTIYGDLRVQAGKLTSGVLRHRAATMTLKLVNAAGGEALANTSFSILTPGGDVIREMIGAFPSLVLAEGEYVAIARHDNKTYQATFKVVSNQDRDVDVLAQEAMPNHEPAMRITAQRNHDLKQGANHGQLNLPFVRPEAREMRSLSTAVFGLALVGERFGLGHGRRRRAGRKNRAALVRGLPSSSRMTRSRPAPTSRLSPKPRATRPTRNWRPS